MDINTKVKAFCNAWQSLNIIYEDYARKAKVSYNFLYILNTIKESPNCTQKQICEQTLLPKQTVNNVISNLLKNDYIKLVELSENRRIKTIHLTDKGKQYADTLIPHIHHANQLAMETLTKEQQETLLHLMDIYVSAFRKEMLGD